MTAEELQLRQLKTVRQCAYVDVLYTKKFLQLSQMDKTLFNIHIYMYVYQNNTDVLYIFFYYSHIYT